MSESVARTPLYDWHVAHQARMVEFGGWSMPVQYTSIVDEHLATRSAIGLFDISHMGRLQFEGPDAGLLLDRLLTRKVLGLSAGKIRYSLITNESGGILDDVLVYCLPSSEASPPPAADVSRQVPSRPEDSNQLFYLLVVNASNRLKIVDWIRRHLRPSDQVSFRDQTLDTAMVAVQGPKALEVVMPLVEARLMDLEYYTGVQTSVAGAPCIASRTGYTGEDGCELIFPKSAAVPIWEQILAAGQSCGAKPAGLGARDTLRLEAAMPLYGHELSEQIDPFQAGLGFAVHLNHEFIGREALAARKNAPASLVRVGLELSGKRVPREHYPVLEAQEPVGEVTSGTFSPTLEKPIAMAYVRASSAVPGRELAVDIRGKLEPARVVALPFFKRAK